MKILTNTGGLAETNCYMVVDEAGKARKRGKNKLL